MTWACQLSTQFSFGFPGDQRKAPCWMAELEKKAAESFGRNRHHLHGRGTGRRSDSAWDMVRGGEDPDLFSQPHVSPSLSSAKSKYGINLWKIVFLPKLRKNTLILTLRLRHLPSWWWRSPPSRHLWKAHGGWSPGNPCQGCVATGCSYVEAAGHC